MRFSKLRNCIRCESLEPRRLLSFSAGTDYAIPDWGPGTIVAADMNGDGRLDFATENAQSVTVWTGNADGSLWSSQTMTTSQGWDLKYPASIDAADFDGDGNIDLACGDTDGGAVMLFSGNGDGTVDARRTIYPWLSQLVRAADFNSDGKSDLAVAGGYSSWDPETNEGYSEERVSVLLGNGDGTFTTAFSREQEFTRFMTIADLNADGNSDIVIPGYNQVAVLLGAGDGTFAATQSYPTGAAYPGDVVAADFNGDGKLDLAVAASFNVQVMLGNGNGSFQNPTSHPTPNASNRVDAADFNADGRIDLVAIGGGTASVLLNASAGGSAAFLSPMTFSVDGYPFDVTARDFNNDGRIDLAVSVLSSLQNPGFVRLMLNDGNWPVKTWIGPASGGNWSTAANWSPGGAPAASDNVLISGSSVVNLSASATISTLTLAGGASLNVAAAGDHVFRTSTLAINGSNSKLNLNDNDLIVEHGSFTAIRALVTQGFGPSATTGITSSTSNGTQILALFDNALVGAAHWQGQPIPSTAIVGKYTYFGDANFDGQVTGDDYAVIDSNLNTDPAPGIEWLRGDMNLDGIITGDDYAVIDSNLGLGAGSPLAAAAMGSLSDEDDNERERPAETL